MRHMANTHGIFAKCERDEMRGGGEGIKVTCITFRNKLLIYL